MKNAQHPPAVSRATSVRGVVIALALMASGWPMAARAFSVELSPCLDNAAYFELMEPHDNPASNQPKTLSQEDAGRLYARAAFAPWDPLPLGLMLGDLGLLRNPCMDKSLSLTAQGLFLREDARARGFLASTFRLSIHDAWQSAGPDLFASLTWLAWRSEGGSPRLGPASIGVGYGFFVSGHRRGKQKLHTFVRVHLPPTFVASSSTRLGVEPGVAWRFAPSSGRLTLHGGATLPWLNVETLDGTRAGLRLAPTASVTWRTAGYHVFTGEAGARVGLHQLEQVTVGGAWRTVVFRRLSVELDGVAAVAGSRRGSFTLGARLGVQ
ncbi:hypothetical protein ACLESO_39850 [Pyxidicoccus sp. 3LG]